MTKTKNQDFNPVMFLMSLGAGGMSISLWAFLMFTIEHGKGLVTRTQVQNSISSLYESILYNSLEVLIIILALIHFVTLFYLLKKYFSWRKTKEFLEFKSNPLKNNALMAVFLTIDMAFNICFSIGNYFIIQNGPLFQVVMAPALIGWIILFFFAMKASINILKTAFTSEFDMNKMHFGFLIHPFALAMIGVTGLGIAVFAQNPFVSNLAFLLALAPFTSASLLLTVKFVTMFQHHMKNNLPDRNFLPSTLIVMPIVMLLALSVYRMLHYFHEGLGLEIPKFIYIMVLVIPWVFLNWYGVFGLTLIKDYFKNFKNFDVTQWAFICPIAAYTVLGYFVSKTWLDVLIPMNYFLLIVSLLGVILYFNLFVKQIKVLRN